MRVLGIDPGTIAMGYGVIEGGDELAMVDCGVLAVPSRKLVAERLRLLYSGLSDVIARHRPSEVAIEEPFVAKNIRSALAVGQAQAVAILVATNSDLPVFLYTPTQVKCSATGYGSSDKEQVQEMVRIQLGLAEVPEPSDAADALAVAICHISETRLSRILADSK